MMAVEYTREQLNNMSHETLVQLFLAQQDQLKEIDNKLQLLLEQVAVLNRNRFGRRSEKLGTEGQLSFTADGEIVLLFNEAEAISDAFPDEDDEETAPKRGKKTKGKREADISGLPKTVIKHELSEEELREIYGDENWKRLPDAVFSRYCFVPAKIEIEEHHVAVYSGVKSDKMVRAPHPAYLLRNSLASPSVVAAIINGKFVNAMPYDRIAKEFERQKMPITAQNMASWTIRCTERYLSLMYDRLHQKLYDHHVIQADETPCLVNKDGRPAGSKSYMWVYRTGSMTRGGQIILYQYQKTRNASHPREFLKEFNGICVTDGYQVYHTIENEREDLKISGCWSHARRRFDEALKAMPENKRSGSIANLALKQIQAIYAEEGKLGELPPEERLELRQGVVVVLMYHSHHVIDERRVAHDHVDCLACHAEAVGMAAQPCVLRLQPVEADGHGAEAGVLEFGEQFGREVEPVRHHSPGEAALLDALCTLHDVLPHQRFSAGDPYFGYSKRGCCSDSGNQFLFRHHFFMAFLADPILRHTIPASQIAQFCHRQTKICN